MPFNQKIKKYTLLVGVLFLFPASLIYFLGNMGTHHFASLPYFGPPSIDTLTGDTTHYRLPHFELTNHQGLVYNSDSLEGEHWVAVFISLDSPHLKKITKRLMELNFRTKGKKGVKIICFSTNPAFDQPAELAKYMSHHQRYNANYEKWQYLTGDSASMQAVIQKGFMLNDYQNTAQLWLVDRTGHLRGRYNGNREDEIGRAVEDISLLLKEDEINAQQ